MNTDEKTAEEVMKIRKERLKINEVARLQEALFPLGYEIDGFNIAWNGKSTLHLTRVSTDPLPALIPGVLRQSQT